MDVLDMFNRYTELRTEMEWCRMIRAKDGQVAGILTASDVYAVRYRSYQRQANTLDLEIRKALRK